MSSVGGGIRTPLLSTCVKVNKFLENKENLRINKSIVIQTSQPKLIQSQQPLGKEKCLEVKSSTCSPNNSAQPQLVLAPAGPSTMCDKCNYTGENIRDMEGHRKAEHSYFVYFCSACDYETSNFSILKQHKQTKHRYITTGTEKRKLSPPPKCNPRNKNHSSECCDRNPNQGKALIYTNEERQQNGICLNWNRGDCPNFELCKFLHIEIEACRYQNNCSRTNCKYWHNINGKFPFLWDARPRQMGEN